MDIPPATPHAFCPGPYFGHSRIEPCLADLSSTITLLLFIVVVGSIWQYRFTHEHSPDGRNGREDRDARRTLLDDQGRANNEEDGDGVQARSRSNRSRRADSFTVAARALTIFALITFLLDLALDLYLVVNPELPSTLIRYQSARTTADVLGSFAWLLAAALVSFAGSMGVVPSVIQQFWALALVLESVQMYQWIINIVDPLYGPGGGSHPLDNFIDVAHFVLFLARYLALLSLLVMAITHRISARRPVSVADEETGTSMRRSPSSASMTAAWSDTIRKCRKLLPFLWPRPMRLQLLVLACFFLLGLGRVVNLLVPMQYGVVVNDLSGHPEDPDPEKRRPYFAYGAILLYVFFRFLQGGVGLLSSLQYFLWIPVGQYTTREVSVRMLEHLHSLSLQFHINRKTGEVLRVMDRGTASIGSLLSYLAFNILPVFVDIAIAVVYFIVTYDWAIGLIVFFTMALYIVCTIWITEWRTKFRREMNELDSASRARAVDSLLNFETVKYYNNEAWEVNQYDEAIRRYQQADWKSSSSLNVLNTAQNLVITIGLMAGLLLCGKRVADGEWTVGAFVLFLAYLLQLYQPLNWFGTYYRVIQQNFIDMEKMLDLFEEHQAVQDAPDAKDLLIKEGGSVVFDDVSFAYDPRQTALYNVKFTIPAGKTVALVGPSGGGKSTIFRLLFRFYDVTSGSIKIDGQDLRKVTLRSMRQHIGVVPQDTVLFNETIRYNIRYGNVNATDEEVEAAARAAQIHDRILTFPDGYDTKVGERGLRLSGGEKQRIAIARTLLKNPSIILLDEATSALDNTTERLIQDSLKTLSANRTTLVIAHRLSTIVDADVILVMKDGRIVERGTHDELLKKGEDLFRKGVVADGGSNGVGNGEGTYYSMWMRQGEEDSKRRGSVVPNGQAHLGVVNGASGLSPGHVGPGFVGGPGAPNHHQQGKKHT